MKPSFNSTRRMLGTAALAVVCLLVLPESAQAKGPKPPKNQHGKTHQNDRAWQTYSSHPRSGFTLSFGTGYAGSGYYYGPPNSAYYYERPDVRY